MEAAIFDWDGTLADSLGILYCANAAVMKHFGLAFDRALYRRHFAPDWRVMYQRLGIPAERIAEAGIMWRDAFDSGGAPGLLPGAEDALVRLRAAGVRLALVTSGERDLVAPQLERVGLASLLPIRVFADDLDVSKPDPAPLRRALEELGLERRPGGAVYLGDTLDDMRMAVAAGVVPVGVASDMATADELRAAGATDVVASVADWVAAVLPTAAVPERGESSGRGNAGDSGGRSR